MKNKEKNIQNDGNINSPFRGLGGLFFRGLGGILFMFFISVNLLLAQTPYKLRFAVQQYDHSLYNKMINRTVVEAVGNDQILKTTTGEWTIETEKKPVTSIDNTFEYSVIFRLTKGYENSAAVLVELDFENWSKDNYVLLPAAAYNGNRFESRRIPYSPKLNDARDIGKDKPIIVSDVPRLNIADGLSQIQERSGAMALPCIGFQSVKYKQGFFLTTVQRNLFGDLGMNIEESANRQQAEISLCSPLVRERSKYLICDNQAPSTDLPADFKAGDELMFTFRVYNFDAPEIQSVFDKYLLIRKDLCPASEFIPQLPFSACFNLLEKKFNAENFVPEWGYYSVGMRSMFLQDWQIGWTGGMISTYPLLFSPNEQTRRNVIANFDWLFPNGISPSGFFWDSGEKGNKWYGGDIRKPQAANWHLIRKSADALYYILKQFDLMKRQGITVKPLWENGTRGVADAFVKLWQQNHQFGQFVDSQSGEIAVGGSSGAGLAPAALMLASVYYKDKKYETIALESAQALYDNFVRKGISCGGPGDALQNPDSESLYGLLESFAVLYEMTGDKKWLNDACETAAQFSTWVMSYDYVFPSNCLFGQLNMKTTGAVFANTQNKHGSPGICTHSGLALLRIYRATGNPVYLQLLQDIARSIPQYMSRPDRSIKGMHDGWINERVSTTDWFEGIGEIFPGSTWAETDLMLTIKELPGVYVDLEKQTVTAFDQVQAELISGKANSARVKISNPTKSVAYISLLAESAKDKLKSWSENRFYGKKGIELKPGETKILNVNSEK